MEAGDRELPQLSVYDDSVRCFVTLMDEYYSHKVPLYPEARVPSEALYTEGYPVFAFRCTLSRLHEMQLARSGIGSVGQHHAVEARAADSRPRSSAGQIETQ